ncbi:MAG: alpha/beta fold hydrolase [Chloroflexota bacterium]
MSILPEIKSEFVEVDDLRLHYLIAGEGEAVLLLHGWPTSAYLWRNVMPAMAQTHRVIALDLPGYGQSTKRPSDSFSFFYHEKALDGFLATLGIDKIHLVVHDLGGPVGLFWAVRQLERVHSLTFLNTIVYPDFSWGVKLFAFMTMAPGIRSWLSSPRGIAWAMRLGVQQKEKLTPKVIANYTDPFQERNVRKTLLKSVQRLSLKGYDEIVAKLFAFEGPVCLIYGENDQILPRIANTMHRLQTSFPQAELTSLPNCGHFLQEDEPEKLGKLLAAFLTGVS